MRPARCPGWRMGRRVKRPPARGIVRSHAPRAVAPSSAGAVQVLCTAHAVCAEMSGRRTARLPQRPMKRSLSWPVRGSPVAVRGGHPDSSRRVAPGGLSVAELLGIKEIPVVDAGAGRGRAGCRRRAAVVARRMFLDGRGLVPIRGRGRFSSRVAGAWPDRSGACLESVHGNLEPLRGAPEQLVARGAGSVADRRASALHRSAAGRETVVGRGFGVAVAHANAVRLQRQLLAADQRQRIVQPLAQLHLAGQHGNGAVGLELQPVGDTLDHGADSPAAAAACSVARIIRLWAPQRQMLRSSAAWICSRVGDGSRSSRAAAAIITPAGAVAALDRVVCDERLLNGMQVGRRAPAPPP